MSLDQKFRRNLFNTANIFFSQKQREKERQERERHRYLYYSH